MGGVEGVCADRERAIAGQSLRARVATAKKTDLRRASADGFFFSSQYHPSSAAVKKCSCAVLLLVCRPPKVPDPHSPVCALVAAPSALFRRIVPDYSCC